MKWVQKLGTDEKYGYSDKETPYECMRKMLCTLNTSHKDTNAVINKTESGSHLYIDHRENTYAIRNN